MTVRLSSQEITVKQDEKGDLHLRFVDNGKGIPADSLDKIFEPFFTTRRGHGSTGLGLHILYNIVTQQLGGSIQISSQLGVGTRFDICIRPEKTLS